MPMAATTSAAVASARQSHEQTLLAERRRRSSAIVLTDARGSSGSTAATARRLRRPRPQAASPIDDDGGHEPSVLSLAKPSVSWSIGEYMSSTPKEDGCPPAGPHLTSPTTPTISRTVPKSDVPSDRVGVLK
jgi:hypothetical protein